MLQHGYLRWQTDVVARLLLEREPQLQAPEELPHGSFVGGRMPPKQKTRVSGGLSRALYCSHIAVPPPFVPIRGGSPMWVTLGIRSGARSDPPTCRSRLIQQPLDSLSVTFFLSF